MNGSLLETDCLTIDYQTRAGPLRAVNAVSLAVASGETVAIVGESGCGKSSLAKAMVGMTRPTSGALRINGVDVSGLGRSGWRQYRSIVQMVFQDPYSSLNPRRTIRQSLEDALRGSGRPSREWPGALEEVLEAVSLRSDAMDRYPHALSGGQRQRIGIARGLLTGARLLICDEPVSALDLSVQAQILNLLADLKRSSGMTYVFISHDLGVVQHVADHVHVMYLGHVVESGPRARFWANARHPYTEALFAAVPRAGARGEENRSLHGEVPSASDLPRGCVFHTRCPIAQDQCRLEKPLLRDIGDGSRLACHLR